MLWNKNELSSLKKNDYHAEHVPKPFEILKGIFLSAGLYSTPAWVATINWPTFFSYTGTAVEASITNLNAAIIAYADAPTATNEAALTAARAAYRTQLQTSSLAAVMRASTNDTPPAGRLSVNLANVSAAAIQALGNGILTINNYTGAGVGGGAISMQGQPSVLDINAPSSSQMVFSNNRTTANGGAGGAILFNGTFSVNNATFRDNSASVGTPATGGAVNAISTGGLTIVSNSIFSGNTTSFTGGALRLAGNRIAIIDSIFTNNTAGNNGGAINNGAPGSITRSIFSGNTSGALGGALNTNAFLNLTDSTFVRNTATTLGGAVSIVTGASSGLNLNVSPNNKFLFEGNYANNTPSSIGFSTVTGIYTFNANVDTGGVLDMRDPMSSGTLLNNNATITINKLNPGVWRLGGTTVYQVAGTNVRANYNISQGSLYFYAQGEVLNERVLGDEQTVSAGNITFPNTGFSFNVATGATAIAGGNNQITSGTINFQNGSLIRGGTATDRSDGATNIVSQLSLTSPANLAGTVTLSAVDAGDQFTFNGTLASTGGITKAGAGRVILNNNNTYSGVTTISSGVLQVGAGGTTGSIAGNSIVNNASLVFNRSDAITYAGVISGTGTVIKEGPLGLTLTGANTYTGNTTVSAGTLQIGNNGTTGSLASSQIINNSSVIFNRSNASSFAGGISGSGSLTKLGAGALTLTGDSTFTGGTTVTAGILQLGLAGNTGSLIGNITNNATLTFNRLNNSTYSGVISGTGVVNKLSTGILSLAGNSTYTGATQVQAGELNILGNLTQSNVTVNAGASLSGGNGAQLGQTVTVNGTLKGVGGETLTMSSLILGANSSLAVTLGEASGSALFNVANNLTLDGTLAVTPAAGFGAGIYRLMNYGTTLTNNTMNTSTPNYYIQTAIANQVNLVNTTDVTLNFWDGTGPFNNNVVNGGNGTWRLDIGNWTNANGSLNAPYKPESAMAVFQGASGTVTLSNANGQVTASGLQFAVDGYTLNSDTLALVGAGIVRVGDGTIDGRNFNVSINSVLSGSVGLTKTDLGTATLNGSNSYTGGTFVNGGVLSVSADNRLGALSGGLLMDGGSLRNTGAFSSARPVTLGSLGGTFLTDANLTLTNAISGTGSLTKSGTQTLTLGNTSNTYSGGTVINDGTLIVGADASLGNPSSDLTFNGGILQNNASITSNRNMLFNNEAELSTLSNFTLNGVISGSGGLIKSGSGDLILTGNNTYTGGTVIDSGNLLVGNGGTSGSINGNIENNSSITFNRSNELTYTGDISGSGNLTKLGAGQLTLSTTGTYTGATNVQEGRLHVNGSLTSQVTVGSNGSLSGSDNSVLGTAVNVNGSLFGVGNQTLFMDSLAFSSGSTLDVSLNVDDGTPLFQVNQDLILDGQLEVTQGPLFGAGVYHLINYGGTLTNNIMDSGSPNYYIQTSIANQVNLVNTTGVSLSFWDGTGPFNNGVVNGGTGTWDATAGNWTNASGEINAPYQPEGAFAVFQGTPGTVTIDNSLGALSATGLQFAVNGYTLTGGELTLTDSATVRVGDGNAGSVNTSATISGVINGSNGLVKTDLGTLILGGNNTYTGGTTVNGGVLSISSDSNLGAASGPLTLNNSVLTNTASVVSDRVVNLGSGEATFVTLDDLVLNNTVGGSGALIKKGNGALILNSSNTYNGGTLLEAGLLRAGAANALVSNTPYTVNGGTLDLQGFDLTMSSFTGQGGNINFGGAILAVNQNTPSTYAGRLTGTGQFIKQGASELILSAESDAFAGQTQIENGILTVNGTLSGSMNVEAGGRLQGMGTVSNVTVNGVIAPTNFMRVIGDYTQNPGSFYEVLIASQGTATQLSVSGVATLNGGTVNVLNAGEYIPNTRYTLLTAAGGVNGTYNNLNITLPFLNLILSYDTNNVYLDVDRSSVSFPSVARTPNQKETAIAVESLGAGNEVYDAIVNLAEVDEIQQAFDNLSGEAHVSAISTFLEDSRYLRDATLNRLQQSSLANKKAVNLFQHQSTLDTPLEWTWWTQGYGAWGELAGNYNAAKTTRKNKGVILGADHALGNLARVGLVSSYNDSNFDIPKRFSNGHSNNYSLGAYAGISLNQWRGRFGGAYTWQDVKLNRQVSFPGFYNALSSNYDAHTTQGFMEIGYEWNRRRVTIEPFVGLAYIDVGTDSWAEKGGAAALQGKDNDNVFYSTSGVRETVQLYQGERFNLNERALLGWRHAYSGLSPQSTLTFVSGSLPFNISGAPLAEDALLIDAGVNCINPGNSLSLRLSYLGQIASAAQDHGLAGTIVWTFS